MAISSIEEVCDGKNKFISLLWKSIKVQFVRIFIFVVVEMYDERDTHQNSLQITTSSSC